jgi:predicted transglutaminase-like cysteine proteinase
MPGGMLGDYFGGKVSQQVWRWARATAFVLATLTIGAAQGGEGLKLEGPASAPVIGPTTKPIGHVEFCRQSPEECTRNGEVIEKVQLTEELSAQLQFINDRVNSSIRPVTDRLLYQVTELWTYPSSAAGDCEDFVLEKRRALLQAGWSPSTLLIAVVRQTSGEGHAVLMVRTDQGDLVLDNLDPDIHLWTETPYTYLKRQSQADTGEWESLADQRDVVTVASH